MTRKEVAEKLEEIVEFSGVRKFIDTPVKHYSSGMYVRLAFAVAAHLEPEILIIDEVLAVGDAEFQKKCLGKMKDVAGEGRTVIFVSHDLAAVKSLCTKGVVLNQGKVSFNGKVEEAVLEYQKLGVQNSSYTCNDIESAIGNENIKVLNFEVTPVNGEIISISSGINVRLEFYNLKENINLDATFELRNLDEQAIFHTGVLLSENSDSKKGNYTVNFSLPANLLNTGNYYFKLIFGENQRYALYINEQIVNFEVQNETLGSNSNKLPGIIRPKLDYHVTIPK